MNPSKFFPAVLALGVLFILPGCLKEYNYVKQHPGAEVTGCRIRMMMNGPDTFRVYYNDYGDPTDMVATPLFSGWIADRHFRYDKHHRLTDFIYGQPDLTDFRIIWHRYTYISKSLVSDSLFTYITDGAGPNPPLQNFSVLTIDSLDAEGRIVKLTQPGFPSSTKYINYNAKGNIQDYNEVYDNKLNIYHTSRVWMFTEQDYSVNNRLNFTPGVVQITSYNAAGLPLVFQVVSGPASGLFLNIGYQKLQVVYDCDDERY